MAPKKKKIPGRGSSGASISTRAAPKLQISAGNEAKLRRLLLNNSSSAATSRQQPHSQNLSEQQLKQAARRLRAVYDDLASEGFSTQHIQQALAAVPAEAATLEACLDWLCLNLPANELPLKFCSGKRTPASEGGSVQVLLAASTKWIGCSSRSTEEDAVDLAPASSTSSFQEEDKKYFDTYSPAEHADWIRRYVAEQEEESDTDDERTEHNNFSGCEVGGPPRTACIPAEFRAAKRVAAEAKRLGNKDQQAAASKVIWGLKQELLSLGLSESVLESSSVELDEQDRSRREEVVETGDLCGNDRSEDDTEANVLGMGTSQTTWAREGRQNQADDVDSIPSCEEGQSELGIPTVTNVADDGVDGMEVEGIADMFDEMSEPDPQLPLSIISLQLDERARSSFGNTRVKSAPSHQRDINSRGKSGGTQKEPKVVLQQHCQKHGWVAPKYDRLSNTKDISYLYSVTVNRPPSGRGKNRVPGGPICIRLPAEQGGFKTAAEAQNVVAAWALFTLFPELPLYRVLPSTYQALYKQWLSQEGAAEEGSLAEDASRASFIDAVLSARVAEFRRTEDSSSLDPEVQSNGPSSPIPESNKKRSALDKKVVSRHLLQDFEDKQLNSDYKRMMKRRNALPMSTARNELLEKLKYNDVILVSGETGSGKTTQVPQYILDEMIMTGTGGLCNIICTQPRRIAAISVAERVAVERCEPPPGSYGSLVGYQVRLDAARNPGTRLLFCTTGILLRRVSTDPDLAGVSHVVVDEVHERTVLGDFMLIILKELITRRHHMGQPLKLIVMSATVDPTIFSEYFGGCPVISVEGRTHPVTAVFLEDVYEWLDYKLLSDSPAAVQQYHQRPAIKNRVGHSRGRQNLAQSGVGDETILVKKAVNPFYDADLYQGLSSRADDNLAAVNEEIIDYDLVEELIIAIDEKLADGAILVFLPGQAEIRQVQDRLRVSKRFSGLSSEWILPLHSAIAIAEQRKVFATPQYGGRKVVLATNIAEASITIDDVVYVIDCGKHKQHQFDPRRGMSSLVESWISQANVRQRMGRAGRVQPGRCFCLYTSHRYRNLLRPFPIPEMLRVPLVEICLQIKVLSLGDVASVLEKAVESPTADAVQSALSTLHQVGAVDEHETLTSLGYHLALLPVDVHVGKMILYGAIFGCLSPIVTVAACLSHKTPFVIPHDEREAAARKIQTLLTEAGQDISKQDARKLHQSDHLAMVAAYNHWVKLRQRGGKAVREFCSSNYLNQSTLETLRDIRIQLAALVEEIGFVTSSPTAGRTRDEQWIDDFSQPFNKNSCHASVVKAVICAGLYPNVVAMHDDDIKQGHASALSLRAGLSSGRKPRWFDGHREVFVHPSSHNFGVTEFQHPFLVFHEKISTSKVYMRDTTVVSPSALLLFGGTISVEHKAGLVTVDQWLQMHAPAQTAVYFKELRLALDSLLHTRIGVPRATVTTPEDRIIPIIVQFLIDEEKPSSTSGHLGHPSS